jgi:hypothetical protein
LKEGMCRPHLNYRQVAVAVWDEQPVRIAGLGAHLESQLTSFDNHLSVPMFQYF